jgi:hypothetical protein
MGMIQRKCKACAVLMKKVPGLLIRTNASNFSIAKIVVPSNNKPQNIFHFRGQGVVPLRQAGGPQSVSLGPPCRSNRNTFSDDRNTFLEHRNSP